MNINDLAINHGNEIYYQKDFRIVLESHFDFLRNHPTTTTISIDPHKVYVYEFDFYSLLAYYAIPTYLRWLTMKINNIDSPTNFPSNLIELKVLSPDTVEKIFQIYKTTHRITT